MNELSEKFDQASIEFDREVIWDGIKKPRRFPLNPFYVLLVLFMATGVVLFLMFSESITDGVAGKVARKVYIGPDAISTNEPGQISASEQSIIGDIISGDHKGEIQSIPSTEKGEIQVNKTWIDIKDHEQVEAISSTRRSESFWVDIKLLSEGGATGIKERSKSKSTGEVGRGFHEVSSIALSGIRGPVEGNGVEIVALEPVMTAKSLRSGKHSLSIQGSIGFHKSKLSNSTDEELQWRDGVEKPQLDYGVGLRYEYALKKNFLLAVTLGYNLYKDNINTSNISKGIDKDVIVDYDLYNHYHVFSGQVGIGKRFYQKHFFWDIQAGLGVKFYQITEADYFIGENMLAPYEQVSTMYKSTPDIYFSGQVAIGKQLSTRSFIRAGLQYDSGFVLSQSQAEIMHRIIPVSTFVSLGYRM